MHEVFFNFVLQSDFALQSIRARQQEMVMKEEKIQSYLKDISYIKGIIRDNEENVIIEHWAWYAWAFMTLAGSLLHFYLYTKTGLSAADAFLYIWLPVFLIGVILESLAVLIRSGREDVPFFSRKFLRFILAVITTSIILITMIIHLMRNGSLVPGIILIAAAAPFSLYGIWSISYLFIESFILLIAGLVLYIGHGTSAGSFLFSGVFCSIVFAAGGIHSYLFDKKRTDKRNARTLADNGGGEKSDA
jgi:hypothetical protein